MEELIYLRKSIISPKINNLNYYLEQKLVDQSKNLYDISHYIFWEYWFNVIIN